MKQGISCLQWQLQAGGYAAGWRGRCRENQMRCGRTVCWWSSPVEDCHNRSRYFWNPRLHSVRAENPESGPLHIRQESRYWGDSVREPLSRMCLWYALSSGLYMSAFWQTAVAYRYPSSYLPSLLRFTSIGHTLSRNTDAESIWNWSTGCPKQLGMKRFPSGDCKWVKIIPDRGWDIYSSLYRLKLSIAAPC